MREGGSFRHCDRSIEDGGSPFPRARSSRCFQGVQDHPHPVIESRAGRRSIIRRHGGGHPCLRIRGLPDIVGRGCRPHHPSHWRGIPDPRAYSSTAPARNDGKLHPDIATRGHLAAGHALLRHRVSPPCSAMFPSSLPKAGSPPLPPLCKGVRETAVNASSWQRARNGVNGQVMAGHPPASSAGTRTSRGSKGRSPSPAPLYPQGVCWLRHVTVAQASPADASETLAQRRAEAADEGLRPARQNCGLVVSRQPPLERVGRSLKPASTKPATERSDSSAARYAHGMLAVGTEIGLVEKLAATPCRVLTVSSRVQAAAWRRDESRVLEVLAQVAIKRVQDSRPADASERDHVLIVGAALPIGSK